MKTITTHQSITNTSNKHLLVGNCHHIIAAYETREEAVADLDNQVPCIEASPWGSVKIIAPGETAAGDYCQTVPRTRQEEAALEAEWEKLPWMQPKTPTTP